MGLLQTIFGTANPAIAAGEGVAGAVTGIANTAANIVERWVPGDADKVKMQIDVQESIAKAVNEARQYDPRTQSTRPVEEFINVSVDALCRLIRPVTTIVLLGGVFGWWNLQTKSIDPTVLTWGTAALGYWFGIRTITQDIPKFITAVRSARAS